jgi:hypothetical protein
LETHINPTPISGGQNIYAAIALVNEGYAKEYQQPTPKQRVLAYLNDIRNKLLTDKAVEEAHVIANTSELNYV